MTPRIAAVALALAAGVLGPAAARADVSGLWAVPKTHIQVRFAPCGADLCATLINSNRLTLEPGARDDKNKNPALRGRPLRGVTMMWGFRGGPTDWKGGHIYSPGSGDIYPATMTLADADTLKVKGCTAAVICLTQTLKRVR
jgi:uncharacterized protein (DUF2147 family)